MKNFLVNLLKSICLAQIYIKKSMFIQYYALTETFINIQITHLLLSLKIDLISRNYRILKLFVILLKGQTHRKQK